MNNLRIPAIILALIIIGIGAWLMFGRPQNSMMSQTTASTSTSASTQTTQQTAPATHLNPATLPQTMAGTWQSTDDPNYSIIVTTDGTWTDDYKGANASSSVSESGTYVLFTSENAPSDFTGTLVPSVVYVKLVEGSSTFFYSVLEANGNNLQMKYLARGNTLSFTRVQ